MGVQLGGAWLAPVGPLEGLGHGASVVSNEGEHLSLEILHRGEGAAPEQLARQNGEPDLDLVHPRGVLGGVVEDDVVAGISQEGGPRVAGAQNALLARLCWPLRSSEPTSTGPGRGFLIISRVTRHERMSCITIS